MIADNTFIISRVLTVFTLMTVGLVGNSLVLIIYIKNKTQAGRTFLIILSVADLFANVVTLPQIPFWELEPLKWNAVIFPQVVLAQMTYVLVTVAMALERVLAVFTPYKYKTYRRTMLKVMVTVAMVVITCLETGAVMLFMNSDDSLLYDDIGLVYYVTLLLCEATGLLVVMVAYPAIAIRLYRQQRQIQPANNTAASASAVGSASQNKQQENTAQKHAKALKLYVGILALYLTSFIPMTLIAITGNRAFAYGPFINHIGNVFVCFAMIKCFRNQTKQLLLCKMLPNCVARDSSSPR